MRHARQRRRAVWLVLHQWLGLCAGLFFVLLGLTGSVLVFYTELDELLEPALARPAHDSPVAAYEPVLRALREAHPQRERGWRIELPPGGRGLVTARYLKPVEKAGAFFAPLLVSVDPVTLEVRASRFWGETALTWLYDLHFTLLAGETGLMLVGGLGMLWLLGVLSGLALWWPSRRQLGAALRYKRGAGPARRTFDLHKLAGLYGGLLLLLLGVTGTLLALPGVFEPLIGRLSPPLVVAPVASTPPAAGAARIDLDAALARAQARFPQASARWVDTPDGPLGSYRVRLRQPGEPSHRFPRTLVWIDAYSGAVLAVRDAREQGAGDTLLAWLHPLHNGEAFGLAGRIAVCATGWLPLWLAVTGLMRWLDRRRGRRAAQAAAARANAPAPSAPA